MSRTLAAVRQGVYALLTTPPLSYTVNAQAPQTLPATSVMPHAPWFGDDPKPDPMVNFSIAGRGIESKLLPDRRLTLKIWVSATGGGDLVTELYEAVRARLMPPGDRPDGVVSWSRAAGGGTLPLTLRECVERMALAADFEPQTSRWYTSAEFSLVAI